MEGLKDALHCWGYDDAVKREDLFIPGSPERCVARVVVERREECFVLERLGPGQTERRESIAAQLTALRDRGVSRLLRYIPTPDGSFVANCGGRDWQLSRYVPGTELPRPDYIRDPERGEELGGFLAELRGHSAGLGSEFGPPFSLPDYIQQLLSVIRRHEPSLARALVPVLDSLLPFFEMYPELPAALAHGDFHPVNVIWEDRAVKAVIDWEFTGLAPRLYDLANCLGCVGSEDPAAFGWGLCASLIRSAQENGLGEDGDFASLVPLMAAMRFAWISEWLRRDDREMIQLELDYMDIMLSHRRDIERVWGL